MTRMFTSLTLGDVLGRHWGFVVRLYEVEAELVEKLLLAQKKSGYCYDKYGVCEPGERCDCD